MIGLGNSVVKRKLGGGPPAAPVNVSQPFLVGTGEVGTVVTCNRGSWSGSPTPTYTYDFRLDSVSVQNGSSNSYTPLLADDGKTLTCLVTATNSQGSASEGTSNSIVIGIAPSNTIAPTLSPSGTQITGTVITASVGTWTGTPTITYEYRWTRNGSPITGAVNSTYTIQVADDGTTIRCEVRGTNAYGVSSYVASSNSVSAVNAVAPVNTVAPVISGSTTLGSTLTSTTGTWTGIPTPTYSYQWKRNGSNIGGATASTYVTTLADSSANITCDVTATNTAGSATAGSNTITLPSYAPVNTVAPVISGNQWQGQVLTTTNGTWTNSPTTFTYQWRRGGVDIGGATSSTYTLVAADRGTNITCVVTASNGLTASATSNTLAIVDTILDVQNSALAFSTYVLRGAFGTSALIRLRRTNDNAEVDVFATPQGNITLSSIVTGGGTLGTWIGSNSAVIRTLYDQTGNGRNFDITSPTVQPSFITTGTINTRNSRPTFRFNGSTNYLQQSISAFLSAAQFNVFMVYSTTSAAAPDTNLGTIWYLGNQTVSNGALGKQTSTGAFVGEYICYDVRRTQNGLERLGSSTYRRAANTLVQETDNFLTTGTTLRQNGAGQTLDLTSGGANTTTNYTPANSTITGDFAVFCAIASGSPVNFVNGDLSELIIYTASVTNTTVENNQRNRFGL